MHIKNFDPYDFSKKEIEGVPVYFKNLPWAPCIHIYFSFSVGAFSDPVGKEGVAHFLEHMIHDGCPSLPDKKAINEFSRIYMLNSLNAFTSHYGTNYIGKCLPENFPKVFTTLKEFVFEPLLRPEDVEHERKVITQEAWGRYRNEKFLNYIKEFGRNMYQGHERSRIASPLGWPETVAKINREDINNFHKENYVKENLAVFLVGNIQEKDLEILPSVLKNIPSGRKLASVGGIVGKPEKSRFEVKGDDIGDPQEQAEFSILRATNKISEEENEVGIQSRMLLHYLLHERLRIEHSLCYSVSIFWNRFKDYIDVDITVKTAEDKLPLVEKEIWSIINEVVEGKFNDRFTTTHNLAIDQVRSKERLSEQIIQNAMDDLTVSNRVLSLDEVLEDAKKVTYEDIRKLVKKVFDREHTVTEIILPSKK